MRPPRAWLAVAGIWLLIGVGVLTNLATDEFPAALEPYRGWLLPALLVTGCLYMVVELRRGKQFSSLGESKAGPSDRPDALRRVRARIAVALEEQFDGLEPLTLTIDGAASLVDAYDSDQSLLVLGAAGAGKSTELWRLADVLATRAEDDSFPLPIVLALSGWGRQVARPRPWEVVLRSSWLPRRLRRAAPPADEPEALLDWLLARAALLYRIPPPVGRAWLSGRRAVLILDGLDEVDAGLRDQCVRELDALIHEPATPFVVVSCRTADYENLLVRPRLRREVTVAPLSPEQVSRHLDVPVDDDLRRVVDSPLWLRVARVVAGRVDTATEPDRLRHHLLDVYLTALVDARGGDRAVVLRCLGLLARLAGNTADPDVVDTRRRAAPEMSAALYRWVVPAAVPAVVVIGMVLPLVHLYGIPAGVVAGLFAVVIAVPAGGPAGPWTEPLAGRRLRAALGSTTGFVMGAVVGVSCAALSTVLATASHGWRTVALGVIAALAVVVTTKNVGGGVAAAAAVALALWWTGLNQSEFQGALLVVLVGATGVITVVSTLHDIRSDKTSGVGTRVLPAVVTAGFACVVLATAGILGARPEGPVAVIVGGMVVGALAVSAPVALGVGLSSLLGPPAWRIALAWTGLVPLRLRSFLRECARGGLLIEAGEEFRFPHALVREHLARVDVLDGRPGAPPPPAADRDTALARLAAPPQGKRIMLRLRMKDREETFTSPVEAYDATTGTLMLVGPVGSGTSTLVHDLADTLKARVRADPAQPIPLLLDLADLPSRVPPVDGIVRPFTRWLVGQVRARYGVEPATTLAWLADRRVVLLLDGYGQGAHPKRAAEMVREFSQTHDVRVVVAGWKHGPKLAARAIVQRLDRGEVEAELGSRAKEFLGTDWEPWAAVDTVDRIRLVTAAASAPDPAKSYVDERFEGLPPQARAWWRGVTGQVEWQVLDAVRLAVVVPGLMTVITLCFGFGSPLAVAVALGTAALTFPPLARPLARIEGAVVAVALGHLIALLALGIADRSSDPFDPFYPTNSLPTVLGFVVGLGLLLTKGLSLAYACVLYLFTDAAGRLGSAEDVLSGAFPGVVAGAFLSVTVVALGGYTFYPLASAWLGVRPWWGRRRFERHLIARRLAARTTTSLRQDDDLVKRALGPLR